MSKPQSEHRHIKWFNALSAAEKKQWCDRANSVRPIDAWRAWKVAGERKESSRSGSL
jgi:hypothetical protein